MAATYVSGQFASAFLGNGSSVSTPTGGSAFPGNVAAGNAVLVAVKWANQAQTCTVSGVRGTYATLVGKISHTSGNTSMQMFYAPNVTAGAETITATFSGATDAIYLIAMEVTGVPASSALVDTGVNSTDNAEAGTAVDLPALTPSANGSLIFAAVGETNNLGTFLATVPLLEVAEISDGDFETLEVSYYAQAIAASVTPAWTASTTNNCLAMAASILASGGGGGGGKPTEYYAQMARQ